MNILTDYNYVLVDAASFAGLTKKQLLSRDRKQSLTKRRGLAYCYLKNTYMMSSTEIGNMCNRDHTSIITSINKHYSLYEEVKGGLHVKHS